ncbi:MAG TPA: superoxide dismutase [Flavobacterium sp.]|nr:superoxide dismutase [Flavobacterium sp.]
MKRFPIGVAIAFTVTFFSCNDKKLHEVVEVPLPAKEEKITIGHPDDVKAESGAFEISKLPYEYDALTPFLSPLAVELHFSKHYLSYTNNLNKVLAGTENESLPIEDILKKAYAENAELRNNAGGYYNHTFFFESLKGKGGQVKDTLAAAIDRDFGSFDTFRNQFEDAAGKQFGSGWAWLVVDRSGKLQVTSTANQDNPLMPGVAVPGKPILALDVWEHAYYIDYQYRRKKYIEAFWTHINWDKALERYEDAIRK